MKQARIILESTKVEIQPIKGRIKYRLSSEDPDKLLTLLNNIRYRYDPKKIVADI